MKKIGLFYGPAGGSTEKAAKMIAEKLGEKNVELFDVKKVTENDFNKYENLIFGIATVGKDTWDGKHPKSGWEKFFPLFDGIDLKDKTVAMFGLGNQITYPSMFVDDLGIAAKQAKEKGAKLIGQWPDKGYDYKESKALAGDTFLGLALDEDTQDDKTPERIEKWVMLIKDKFE